MRVRGRPGPSCRGGWRAILGRHRASRRCSGPPVSCQCASRAANSRPRPPFRETSAASGGRPSAGGRCCCCYCCCCCWCCGGAHVERGDARPAYGSSPAAASGAAWSLAGRGWSRGSGRPTGASEAPPWGRRRRRPGTGLRSDAPRPPAAQPRPLPPRPTRPRRRLAAERCPPGRRRQQDPSGTPPARRPWESGLASPGLHRRAPALEQPPQCPQRPRPRAGQRRSHSAPAGPPILRLRRRGRHFPQPPRPRAPPPPDRLLPRGRGSARPGSARSSRGPRVSQTPRATRPGCSASGPPARGQPARHRHRDPQTPARVPQAVGQAAPPGRQVSAPPQPAARPPPTRSCQGSSGVARRPRSAEPLAMTAQPGSARQTARWTRAAWPAAPPAPLASDVPGEWSRCPA